jgi:hypothetical protein
LRSDKYDSFKRKEELWVCTSIAFPVDISYDAFNVDYKTVVYGGKGYFIQVKPGQYFNLNGELPHDSVVIERHAKGVMNVVGKPAGIYEYIFVSTANDFCGMDYGDKSIVRVYLVPQPTGFPVLTNICPGETETVNLDNFIPPEIRYFIEEMGWTISYTTLDGKYVKNSIDVGRSNVGNTVYRYTFNDSVGSFKGKFSKMQSSAYDCPEDSAYLTHTVRIREDEEYTIPDKSISFCTDVLKLVPETAESFNTNLFGYLGSSAPGGVWTIPNNNAGINPRHLSVTPTGDAQINVSAVEGKQIVFKYSYKDCMENDIFTLLTFNFDGTFRETFKDQEREVCRNLMSGVVELSSIFGFTAPLTAGIWFQKVGNEFEEMLYGAVAIDTLKSGSLYTFRYNVNEAVDSICKIEDSTFFSIRLHDLEVSSAEAKICEKLFKSGVENIDLSRYVPGLNNAGRINPDSITWRDTLNRIIPNSKNYTLRASNGESWVMPDSAYQMQFQYEVKSNCGPYTGNLYISVVDTIISDTVRKVVICYTDDYAKHVDLFQILGIVGATGEFDLCDAFTFDGIRERIIYPDVSDVESSGIMNAFDLYNKNKTSEGKLYEYIRYVFCYQSSSDGCVPSNMKIEIKVTKNVEGNSDFN